MSGWKNRDNGRVCTVNGVPFYFQKRYTGQRCLGSGAYGVVCSAKDSITKKNVAIKKVSQYSRSTNAAVHILREIRLMRLLGKHKCIITLQNLYKRLKRDEIYMVMDQMDADLHQVIQSDQTLTGHHVQHFMFQLLKGIQYMHACGILHRDLKPGNLLVNSQCDLKIADFGLARERDPLSTMTQHVVTRWYRAPELMLRPNGHYDASVDVWSVGCILGEMIGRKPMFPGKDFIHQLRLIFNVIGAPHKDEVAHIENEDALLFLASLKQKCAVRMSNLFPSASAEVVDLLESILVFQPSKRLTTDRALEHKFMEGAAENYPIVTPPVPSNMECDFEGKKLTKQQILDMIKREVQIVRDQSKAEASNRLRLKRPQSAKVARESAHKQIGRGKTAANIAALQKESAQRVQQLKAIAKKQQKQPNPRPKRIEQRQKASLAQSHKKLTSSRSSHPPRHQDRLAQRSKQVTKKIREIEGQHKKQSIHPTDKVSFTRGRTQSDGNMLHEINRLRNSPRSKSNTAAKPDENSLAPVASRPGVAAANKGKSLVDRKRDLIRRTRSLGDPMFKAQTEARTKTRESLLVNADASPTKQNVRMLSPMARKLNEMQTNFREGKISEESLVQRKRELIQRTREETASATADTSKRVDDGASTTDVHSAKSTSVARALDAEQDSLSDHNTAEQGKKPLKTAMMPKSSLQQKVTVDNVLSPNHKKRTTTVIRPFKFHQTRRRSRSSAASIPLGGKKKLAANAGVGSMRRRLAEAMAVGRLKSNKKLTVPRSPKFLTRSRRRR